MKSQILISLALATAAPAAPPLLPFQGHLTDASGAAIDNGTKVVQFKIYDAPVSGNAVWAGEVHKLSVNKGLVNTILGTKTAFPPTYSDNTKVMFSEPLYIEITVDAQAEGVTGYGVITAADPPLLPRQVLLPANFAHVAQAVMATDGSKIISSEGEIDGSFLKSESINLNSLAAAVTADGGLSADQVATGAIGHLELDSDSVKDDELADDAVDTAALQDRSVKKAKLALKSVGIGNLDDELEARLATIEARLTKIELGRWTSIPPVRLGSMPYNSNNQINYVLPDEIPVEAKEVLLHCYSQQGNASRTGRPKIKIFTTENDEEFAKYFEFYTYDPQDDISSQTVDYWIPITVNRSISLINVGTLAGTVNVGSSVEVIGYR